MIQRTYEAPTATLAWADDGMDAGEQMAWADAADRSLLRLVVCTSLATLLLALAASL